MSASSSIAEFRGALTTASRADCRRPTSFRGALHPPPTTTTCLLALRATRGASLLSSRPFPSPNPSSLAVTHSSRRVRLPIHYLSSELSLASFSTSPKQRAPPFSPSPCRRARAQALPPHRFTWVQRQSSSPPAHLLSTTSLPTTALAVVLALRPMVALSRRRRL